MSNIINAKEVKYSWIRKELVLDKQYNKDARGNKVKIIQEWLSLRDFGVAIDGGFGPVTERAVRQFQEEKGLEKTGVVDEVTFKELTRPMLQALTPIPVRSKTYADLVVAYARQHLAEHPREIGGENCGPWVRMYMEGHHGKDYLWCSGFVCFILKQAADTMGISMPFKRSFSCDTLAERAKNSDIFVSEKQLKSGQPSKKEMPAGSLFLSRRASNDWIHAGLVIKFHDDAIETIEGNTNDEGSREGYEVCKRLRGYKKRDFIRIT